VRFKSFRYSPNVGAKQADLVQLGHKFMHQNCARSFRNEHGRSTPSNSKLIFWGASNFFYYYVKFGVKNGPAWCNWCTSSCNNIASEFSTTTPLDPIYWTLNFYFRAFQIVSLLHESRSKMGRPSEISTQVRATCRIFLQQT